MIFVTLLPGLLYSSCFVVQDPLYEAAGSVLPSQSLVITVSMVNLLPGIYIVPFAGIKGTAFDTTGSMLVLFLQFGREIIKGLNLNKTVYVKA